MKLIARNTLLASLFLTFSALYGESRNRCMDLYNIHLGYNAFTNITDYALGYKKDLQYCSIIYRNFPKDNESLKEAGKFIMEFATRDNHPPIDSILKYNTDDNGKLLSYLGLCSRFEGSAKWQYFKKLETYPGYKKYFYQTTVLAYPMRWDSHPLMSKPFEFITKYDEFLLENATLTKSEAMLYDLFRLEIELETSKNETAFLSRLENLILENKAYFSVKNYMEFIKGYFPDYKISPKLNPNVNDSFDIGYENNNPIYSSYKTTFNSLGESVNSLTENPFNSSVANYSNVIKWLPKETYQSIIRSLDQLNTMESRFTKVHMLPAISFDLIKNILESESPKFTKPQENELKARILKKWLDFHIACQITIMFYMDKNLIEYWDSLPAKDQEELGAYFENELEKTGNHNYLLALKNVLKQK